MATADSQVAVSAKAAADTGAQPAFSEFLEDMQRRNAAESDHRNIMTPEFREFCIVTREHIVCWALFLVLFAGSYALVARACTRRKGSLAIKDDVCIQQQPHGHQHRHRRFLVAPYASAFRARQVAFVIAAAGLASALMTAVLLVVTVALANAMEHDDPRSAPSWRLWLLPATLFSPGDAHTSAFSSGPRAAHDFPPVLRRLWRYQSTISIATAAVAVPLGLLFEGTPRRDSTLRRLCVASMRWALAAMTLLGIWKAAAGSGVSQGATVRYSVHYAASVCVALPAVLGLVPRGTWALFAWLRACVGQRHGRARIAQTRYRRLRLELSRIELRLEQAIGSWKGGQSTSDSDHWISDSGSASASASASDSESEMARSRSVAELPPAHPGLPRNTNFARAQHAARTIAGRPRRLSTSKPSPALLSPPPLQLRALGTSPPSPHLRDRKRLGRRPLSSVSLATSPMDASTVFDADFTVLDTQSPAARDHAGRKRQREREREREMERLSRQIKKYHAQLLFVRAEMARTEKSGLLDISSQENSKASSYIRILSNVSAAVLVAATVLCWLLVVVQVGRGALSAIFVGEPDLTQNITYFLPALAGSDGASLPAASTAIPSAQLAPAALIPHALATCCQLLSAALLFLVVMFGLLSMGTSVEDSVHPLRFLASSYANKLLRARQWELLPYIFLHPRALASILPIHATASAALAVSQVAGNTSRIFFSSSTDLTSFYRHLQRQAAASSSSPNTLLPGGILPEGFFQARIWGRRVFMLFDSQSRPISPTKLLTYAWIVCSLAMTWPSVLRTAGLISERAYILPVASLVEPLWSTVPLQKSALALEEEELVLLPAIVAAHRHLPTSGADSDFAAAINPDDYAIPLPKTLSNIQQSKKQSKKQYPQEDLLLRPTTTASMCIASMSPTVGFSLISELSSALADADPYNDESIGTPSKQQLQKHPASTSVPSASVDTPASAALERRISRRVLHHSLAADTLPRTLVRGVLALSSRVSSHVYITTGYFVWWFFPDLIVPISPMTVDMQLGYLPQASVTMLPVNGFTSIPGHSEWYGMLRRTQLQKLWLPQAEDGTPLVLQAAAGQLAHNSYMARRQSPHRSGKPTRMGSRVATSLQQKISFVFDASMHGVHAIAMRVYSQASAIVWRLCGRFVQSASVVVDSMALHAKDTAAGRVLARVAWGLDYGVQRLRYAAVLVWEEALVPLWHRLSLAATGLSSSISFIVSRAIPLVINLGGEKQPSKAQAFAVADTGLYTVVPSVFLAEFWDAAIGQGSPALQRLRPELWPHLFGNEGAETASNNGHGAFSDHDVILQPLYLHNAQTGSRQAASALHNPQEQKQQQRQSASSLSQKSSSSAVADDGAASSTDASADAQLLSEEDGDKRHSTLEQPHLGDAKPDLASDDRGLNVHSARRVWSTLDWVLAVYRALLGILACRSVFGPSRSSRLFSF
ncbi:hypothetical protein LPJ75_000839 [Coemansia sp. RSA 2598]|nr:hypothetical protein LPJ75_000839 [Coemansia sp. RSA 2598]